MGSFSVWHWVLVLLIVLLIFGTKKLKGLGQDLGDAVKNFKHAITDDKPTTKDDKKPDETDNK